MRRVLTTAALLVAVTMAAGTTGDQHPKSYVSMFNHFKRQYNKSYANADEEARRLAIFVENMHTAEKMQRLNPHAEFGMNGFSDISAAEFKVKHSGEASFRAAIRKRATQRNVELAFTGTNNVKKIDWRTKGAVTPVKNQMTCGGCWAFSATGNIEGQWAIAGHGLVSLSEQELISCTDTCNGCHGGLPPDAFDWIINTQGGGITSEAQYPFVSGEDVVPACNTAGRTAAAYISSMVEIAHSEAAMAEFVATKGPLSIGVDATSFQTYKGGILSNCVGNQVDHAVLIVGYDFTGPTPYWIIKNQWATTWGIDGYMHLEYGTNQCLLTTLPSSAVVSNPPSLPPAGTPAPPSPPDVTNGTFTQFVCTSSLCMSGCTNTTLPNGKCLSMGSTMSAITSCGQTYLRMMIFNSTDCTGPWQQGMTPLNQCNAQSGGTYLYDECTATNGGSGSGSSVVPPPPPPSSGSSSSGFDEAAEGELSVEEVREALARVRRINAQLHL